MGDFLIQDGQTIVMQGDSITDVGRRGDARPYGNGYVSLFREMITALYPERTINLINKGISGDRVTRLKERWYDDTILHNPDWLSILIGINDLHGTLRNADPVPPDVYRETYDWLLDKITTETNARIIILDPFYISTSPDGTFRHQVLDILPEYITVCDEMTTKYNALQLKTHDIFQRHLQYRESEEFCMEPVHPARGGHIVIAAELLKLLGGI